MIPTTEYVPYFKHFIELNDADKTILENLENSQEYFETILATIPKEKEEYAYAEGKWTIKDIIQHLIDSERVFCYRAMSFVRNDQRNLLGFDQDEFAVAAKANTRNYNDLLEEMRIVRKSTLHLFKSFPIEEQKKIGMASDSNISVRALGAVIAGHQKHHVTVIKECYL